MPSIPVEFKAEMRKSIEKTNMTANARARLRRMVNSFLKLVQEGKSYADARRITYDRHKPSGSLQVRFNDMFDTFAASMNSHRARESRELVST